MDGPSRSRSNMGIDVATRDWLGGYPHESARPREGFRFENEKLGLDLERMGTTDMPNYEFLFRRLGHP